MRDEPTARDTSCQRLLRLGVIRLGEGAVLVDALSTLPEQDRASVARWVATADSMRPPRP
jgi:hypothetical protein